MKFREGKPQAMSKQDVQKWREARKNLERVSSKSREVTDEYLAANRKVIEAEKSIPWWRR